jgi:methionyl-tRNA formyltransferase
MMVYLFCAYRDWSFRLFEKLSKRYKSMILLKSPKKLTYRYIKKINPEYIFFPDWSWMIPKEIVENYRCVCFHESNLPKFRGGSPLQNQILRGITKTKTTAFFMKDGLDNGDIILQKNLSLKDSINDIFDRMILNDYDMIVKIIQGKYKQKKQIGEPTTYKRRNPKQSELDNLEPSKKYIYNFIRMLEDPYPNAFIKIGSKKIVFKSVKFNNKVLEFNGEII